MSTPWWSKTDPHAPPGEDTEPAPGAEPEHRMQGHPSLPQRTAPASHHSVHASASDSLGEQIDGALGEFERRLAQLRETLEDRKAEIIDLESEIEKTEKDQAKAFKSLLSDNPAIKKMLDTGAKRKTNRRKKTRRKSDNPLGGADG